MKASITSVACAVLLLEAVCAGVPRDTRPKGALPGKSAVGPGHVPASVCGTMLAHHGPFNPQTTTPPYKVTVDKSVVAAGDNVTVTLSGTDAFKGVYVQGRQGDSPVGAFQPIDNSAVLISNCPNGTNNALTFVSADAVKQLVITWKAPDTPGEVIFISTFVESFSVFWVGVKSSSVSVVEK